MEAASAQRPYSYGNYEPDRFDNTMMSYQPDHFEQAGPYQIPAPSRSAAFTGFDADVNDSGAPAPQIGRSPSGAFNSGAERKLENSDWDRHEKQGQRRRKWVIMGIICFIVVAVIVGGVVGGVVGSKKSSNAHTTSGASSDVSNKGLYDINSSQVKALLNNDALRRVFPGMDYTPLNAQYPACLTTPPDQNNITLDIAMLSQLTPAVRLYGTDCNQTEMVLKSIDLLNMNSSVQVWLGVWLNNDTTTNDRQLTQMYDILDQYPSSRFAGIIVGNEVLFRKDLTEAQLGQYLQSVRSNLTAKNIDLPVSTSDLGDDWTAALAADTDIVMSNIHPFFAGVTPDEAPGWSWSFWQTHDVVLTASNSSKGYPTNIISEIGWPSEGGNDCGTDAGCPNATAGAVASIDNMNAFMDGWVCQAMANSTTYFW
jgi:exo-beta-1,3-glucanase (GH17 family)